MNEGFTVSDRLNKIYTRRGDQGTTSLASGERIAKNDLRIELLGTLDELNSSLAVLIASLTPSDPITELLGNVQHSLFDMGGEIAMEQPEYWVMQTEAVEHLETLLDEFNDTLPALKEFILPGGSLSAAHTHMCRSICRRCERRICALAEKMPEAVNPASIAYLNRLSDLLFVVSRVVLRNEGIDEVLWRPLHQRKAAQ